MSFTNAFDETLPLDTEDVAQGDDRIREMKRAINERLATVFANWPAGPLLYTPSAAPDNLIATRMIADRQITSAKIAVNSLLAEVLNDLAVVTSKIADSAVTNVKVLDRTLGGIKLQLKTVGTTEIGDLAVTAAQIAAATITEPKYASGSVSTRVLADGSVTSAKLGSTAVANGNLVDQGMIHQMGQADVTVNGTTGNAWAQGSVNIPGAGFDINKDFFICQPLSVTTLSIQTLQGNAVVQDADNLWVNARHIINASPGVDWSAVMRVRWLRNLAGT